MKKHSIVVAGLLALASPALAAVIYPGGGGSGGSVSSTNLTGQALVQSTNISAYQAALLQERTEITISSKGILNGLSATNNDGAMFGPDTPGTTTCGIQEAWNSINKGTEYGPRNVAVSLRFGDGNFFYTNCLVFSNNYTTSIRMEGNDLLSTRLVFAGTAGNTNTIWIRGGGNANTDDGNPALNLPMHFWARHLAFSSILENTNVLVCVTNVSGFQFDQCRFVSWRSMTNNTSGSAVSVASVGNYPGPQGLVGVVAGNVNDHWGIFTSCSWQGLASGGYLFTDHLMIDGAKFAEVGTVGGLVENNLFPNTSPFSLGAGIIRNNGLDTHITDAHFYSTRIGIAALNYSGVTTPDSLILDGFQTEGATYDLAVFNTNGIAVYLKDPRLDYSFAKVSTNGAGVFSLAPSALDVKTVLYGTGGLTNPSTNINAFAITAGTVPAARLPGQFLWGTNADGTITNIQGGVSVGVSKVAITNGGAVVTLGVSPGMIRTLNNGVSTLIDSNAITTGTALVLLGQTNSGPASISAPLIALIPTSGGDYPSIQWRTRESGAAGGSRAWQMIPNYSSGGVMDFLVSTSASGSPQTPRVTFGATGRNIFYGDVDVKTNLWANTITATNGFFLPQLSAIPASVDLRSSSGNTNWLTLNLGGDVALIKTNPAAAISYLTNWLTVQLNFLEGSTAGTPISLTTATAANITSVTLTPGTWDLTASIYFDFVGATVPFIEGAFNTTSATIPGPPPEDVAAASPNVTVVSTDESLTIPRRRVTITENTTYYLVGRAAFSAGSIDAYGKILATRVN